ncbi:MAG: hypothetical protein V4569_13555 [Pseudomonadota bacterium]
MRRHRDREFSSWWKTLRGRQGPRAAWLLISGAGAAFAAPAAAQAVVSSAFTPPLGPASEETARGHGSVSVGYQNTYINGMLRLGSEAPIGAIRVQSISFDLDYFFADRWSMHLGIPFIKTRYGGNSPHCITQAPPQCNGAVVPSQPHPESQFLDDGRYHGTWQDWNLGLAYHANLNNYLLTPSIAAHIPSHDYTFFAQAAAGQGLRKVELALDLAHQFELSNVYYRVRLGRVFVEKTLGQSVNHNKLDLELGYFVNETWTVKVFGVGKKGNGYTGPYDRTTELWYHHDQRALHNYANLGAGLDYHFNDKYTLSATVQRLVWGQFVFDFKYSMDVRLTREF